MNKFRLRLFVYFFILIGIISLLAFSCLNTWNQIYENKKNKQELENKYSELVKKEASLEDEVIMLQDPEYVAKYAREKFLFTKDGELIIDINKGSA